MVLSTASTSGLRDTKGAKVLSRIGKASGSPYAFSGSVTKANYTVSTVNYTVFRFTGNGAINVAEAATADVLIVGGGGGGGGSNNISPGAGGSGGFGSVNSSITLSAGLYTVTIGAGGAGGGGNGAGSSGTSSTGFSYTGNPGGGGGPNSGASGTTQGPSSTLNDGTTSVQYGQGASANTEVAGANNSGNGGGGAFVGTRNGAVGGTGYVVLRVLGTY